MTTLNVSISDSLKHFVDQEVARRGCRSRSRYFQALVKEDARRRARESLEAKLLEGLDSPLSPMTREDWRQLRRRLEEHIAARGSRRSDGVRAGKAVRKRP